MITVLINYSIVMTCITLLTNFSWHRFCKKLNKQWTNDFYTLSRENVNEYKEVINEYRKIINEFRDVMNKEKIYARSID